MLGKCSNPSCSASFRYLGDGRLFRLEADPRSRTSKAGAVEYFWLCDRCASRMSLRIGNEGKISPVVLPAADDDLRRTGAIDRRNGFLLSTLGFSRAGNAVFFG
jgi:hypothetical protein